MKKILMAATAALALAGNPVIAQENAGGSEASSATVGGVGVGTIAAGVVGLAIAGAVVSNNRGSSTVDDGGETDPSCNGDDALVDGVCVGTTTTVTVTGTGTMTSTTTVPVTFTYAPTI
ncbi:hypothetical protein Q4602_01045 [Paraglaciecola chathamensis]|uniref:hypothetical protein n=1 Tax=Paraglaciecola chathamensis TaxID=368405 RepID=UPI00270C6489|nr:hypothetical protein [Paraglaciecola chathamensis]MDO6560399.1 hypothetical protein [Paraglaciecola chathamensis]MDO6838046.1 hypothetical protein [Paraglaciecola chathamensis]